MITLLHASGVLLLLSALAALVFEIVAVVRHTTTISDIVQRWGVRNRFLLVLIESLALAGLSVLAVHFLGVF